MNKRICIFGILLIIFGFPMLTSVVGDILVIDGLVVIGLGVLLDEHKGS